MEFELVTDVGKYPGTIVVDNTGVLALELSDSSTFTLSCLNSKVTPPKPELHESNVQAAESTEGPIYAATDLVQPADEFRQNIPTLQLVLFIGGAVLCIGGLIVIRIVKKHREYDDEDDE